MAGFTVVRPDTAFANAAPKGKKRPREHDRDHLAMIRQLPCCVCGTRKSVEAAHLRMSNALLGKAEPGIAAKPDDAWALPLCDGHHRTYPDSQHNIGEEKFWEKNSIDPFYLCLALWKARGDDILMESIIRANLHAR